MTILENSSEHYLLYIPNDCFDLCTSDIRYVCMYNKPFWGLDPTHTTFECFTLTSCIIKLHFIRNFTPL